uniref:Uncharacterized protein n=1 Tax=Lactuca sativa TaxID=4236 RepID=A0A9R1WXA3_LACSA|nr:hypothetical protein LSAT_V11C900489560 [Lactuca sativa]
MDNQCGLPLRLFGNRSPTKMQPEEGTEQDNQEKSKDGCLNRQDQGHFCNLGFHRSGVVIAEGILGGDSILKHESKLSYVLFVKHEIKCCMGKVMNKVLGDT